MSQYFIKKRASLPCLTRTRQIELNRDPVVSIEAADALEQLLEIFSTALIQDGKSAHYDISENVILLPTRGEEWFEIHWTGEVEIVDASIIDPRFISLKTNKD